MKNQRDRKWLAQASPKDIAAATAAGELQTVLAGGDPPSAALQEEASSASPKSTRRHRCQARERTPTARALT